MNELNYKIEFFSEWHCGSGLSAGADIDALVIKDSDGLPFIPGKTLKGLIREAFEDYASFSRISANLTDSAFGTPLNNQGEQCKGFLFFTDAHLQEEERKAIIDNKAQSFLYQKRTRTAIDENGIADSHTLRTIQTVVPCTLFASILNVPDELCDILTKSLGLVKRMGVNRNRGLGRCNLSIVNMKKGDEQ
ncbi:MAG: CRISPR-associated protein [Muribaculaceae bacterium]|nr:CRISPR-associated protein [Muribaculaceae bacterium]